MSWVNINDITYPVGHVVVTSSSTSPASDLGGTWTLIDKEFSSTSGAATVTVNTTNASSFACEFARGGA